MRDSARKHMDDLLRDFASCCEELNARKDYIFDIATSTGDMRNDRVSGGKKEAQQEKFLDILENDSLLRCLYGWLTPIANALDVLDPDELSVIENSYIYGMDNEKVMRVLDMEPSMYYRRKKTALSKMARQVFGVYAYERKDD